MKKTRPTLHDVANQAAVSIGTASRALNRSGRVSEQTVAKVLKAATRLGYEPDVIAQSMRGKSTGVVGILVSDFANPFFAQIVRRIEQQLQRNGYAALIANTGNDKRREKALIELFQRHRVEAVLLGPCEREDAALIERVRHEFSALVTLDRDIAGTESGLHVDHFKGAEQATKYLLNLGHRRIALLSSSAELRPGRERIAGFKAAYREFDLAYDKQLIRSEQSSMEFVFSEALAMLSSSKPPTAFICLGTRIMAGVLGALRQTGRDVPGGASVISIGDSDLSRLFSPPITTVNWDFDAVGDALTELILKDIRQSPSAPSERITVVPQLNQRNSCRTLSL